MCVCGVLLVSSGSGETGSVLRDQMSVRRRDAATLPSEMLPVRMIMTGVKGGKPRANLCSLLCILGCTSKQNGALHCHELCSRNKYVLVFNKPST